ARKPAPKQKSPHEQTVPAGKADLFRVVWQVTKELLIEPLQTNRVFRNYVCYGSMLTFTATIGGWYYWLQSREVLGFNSLATNFLFLAIGPLAGIITANWWGKLIDRFGRKPVLIIATIGTVISVFPWFFATRDTPSPMFVVDAANWLSVHVGQLFGRENWLMLDEYSSRLVGAYLLGVTGCLIGGSSWTGIGLAQNAIILGFSDGTGRSKYVAAASVLVNFGGAAGGIVGGIVAQKFVGLHLMIGPMLLNNYILTFVISIVVRLASLAWLHGMPDPGARNVRSLFRYWSENTYNNVISRLFFPMRIFGWGRRSNHERRRDE
ncbi:MAG: MFS transporter, partial [Planctomycetaceae bacterium]